MPNVQPTTYERQPQPVTPETVGLLLEAVDQNIGKLKPSPSGLKYDELKSQLGNDRARLYVYQYSMAGPGDEAGEVARVGIRDARYVKQDLAYEDKKTWYRFYRMPGSTVWMTKEFGVSPLSSSDYTDEYGSLDWERYSAADDAYRQAIKEEDYAQGRNVVSEPEALDLLSLLQNATVDEQRRRLVKMARRDYERMFTPTGQGVAAHIKGVLHWLWRS